jgi:hypothetical protein
LYGENDRIILTAFADFIALRIPHAARVEHENFGHMPSVEVVDRFNADAMELMNTI